MTKRSVTFRRRAAIVVACAAPLCLVAYLLGAPAGEGRSTTRATAARTRPATPATRPAPPEEAAHKRDEQIRQLIRKVLLDPLDTASADRLVRLRQQRRRARLVALGHLARGMEVYAQHGAAPAAAALRRVLKSPFALNLADAHLPRSIREILKDVPAPGAGSSGLAGRCPACGGLSEVDCTSCRGAGKRACYRCRGKGQVRSGTGSYVSVARCTACGAKGLAECKKCFGTGLTPCPRCAKKARRTSVDPAEAEAARRVAAIARHLRTGAVDLYSPGALKASPKPPKPAP